MKNLLLLLLSLTLALSIVNGSSLFDDPDDGSSQNESPLGDVQVEENEQNENDADGGEIQLGNNANDDPPNNLQRVLQPHRPQQHEEDLNTTAVQEPLPDWWSTNNTDNNNNNNAVIDDVDINSLIRGVVPEHRLGGNQALLNRLVLDYTVSFGYAVGIGDWPYLHRRLMWLNENRGLLTDLYERGAFTTPGYNSWLRTRTILEEIPTMKEYFQKLESCYEIKHGWVLCYTLDGRHPFHPDGEYRGDVRLVITLGAMGKWMFFRENENVSDPEEMAGVELDHGMTVKLTKEGGSLLAEHAILGDAEGSWFIGLEMDCHAEMLEEMEEQLKKEEEEDEMGEGDKKEEEDKEE